MHWLWRWLPSRSGCPPSLWRRCSARSSRSDRLDQPRLTLPGRGQRGRKPSHAHALDRLPHPSGPRPHGAAPRHRPGNAPSGRAPLVEGAAPDARASGLGPARNGAGARNTARNPEIAVNCPFCGSKARNVATNGHDGVILRCSCSDTEIEITPPGLSKLLAMHDHDARVDVLLKAVRLASPGARPVIRPNCF